MIELVDKVFSFVQYHIYLHQLFKCTTGKYKKLGDNEQDRTVIKVTYHLSLQSKKLSITRLTYHIVKNRAYTQSKIYSNLRSLMGWVQLLSEAHYFLYQLRYEKTELQVGHRSS